MTHTLHLVYVIFQKCHASVIAPGLAEGEFFLTNHVNGDIDKPPTNYNNAYYPRHKPMTKE